MQFRHQARLIRQFACLVTLTAYDAGWCPDIAAQPAASKTSTAARTPSSSEVDDFLARQQKDIDAAQKVLLRAIDKRKAAIRHSKLGTDAIRASLDAMGKDRQALLANGALPKSDELLDDVVACLDNYQDIAERMETFRQRFANRAIHIDDPAAMTRLNTLEARLNNVLVGREHFTQGSIWVGQRHDNKGGFELRLAINNLTGNSFSGELRQSGASRNLARMSVSGKLNGYRISFQNTAMLRGKNRSLDFQGYLLSDRIISSIQGMSPKGEPIAGWVSLWSGADPQASRRR